MSDCQLPSKTFGKATVRLVGEQGPTKKLVWTPACMSELIQPRKQNSTAAKIYVLAGGYLSSSLRRCHRTTETDNSPCVFIFAVCETTGTWRNSFVPYAAKKTHSERVPSVLLPVKLSSGKVSNGGIYPSGFKFLK